MEPRLPFDHHRDNHRHHHHHHQDLNTRYASLPLPPPPPPRFPDDRDFYHHQHHPPQRLQPPPPPPRPRLPPPPPHLSFQYQSFPVEDRRPTFDFHPPPPSNRIPFERSHNHHHHHQQQQPRFLEDHPPDVWPPPPPPPPPPRVSVDNHWDHHNHHSLMSPYKRFADEDEKSFLFRKGNQKEEFLWGERDYHSNRRDAPPPPPRSFDSSSSRFTFGKGTIAEVENVRWGSSAKPSQRESEEQLGENIRWGSSAKPSQRESEEQLGESMRWGSAKPPQREMSSFAYKQHSTVEIGEKEIESEHWLNEDGNRNLSGKRFHNQLKVGKSKKGGSQEFVIYNPKKKVQRTSALLRVGKTPNKCTEEDEETYPSNFPEDSNSGSPSQRRHLVFSEEITDQSKSEGSVDLDVSFKSNALVAKAIMPPGHVIGSDTTSTPNHLKRKKVGSPVFSVSSPRVTEIHEMSPNRDGSKKHLSAVSSSKKSLTPSKDKAATSLIGSSTGINSLPSLDGFSVPTDRSVTKTIPWSAEVGSENKPLNGDRPTENVNVTSSSSKIAVQSKNKGSSSGIGTVGGITSLSRLNGSVVPLEKSRDNVLSLGATKYDKRPLNEDNLTLKLGSGPTCNRALTQSSNEVVISGIGARIDTQPSPNGISIPHEKTPIENRWNSASPADSAKIMQSKSNFSTSSDGAGTADDIGSLLSLSVTGKTPSSISSCQNPLNEYVHTPDTAVTFGKGLCPTNAKHKVSCAKSGVEDVDPEVCRNGTTAVLNAVAKEKTMLNSIAGFDNELNGQSSASKLVESSNFNKGLCLTQPKDKVVIAGLRNGDWEPCPSGVSVPVEMTMTGKTGVSAAVELHGKSSNTEHSIPKVDATSSSNEGLAQSKGDIASHPCLNRTDVPLEATIMRNNPRSTIVASDKNMVKIEGSRLSEAKGTESGSGIQGATCSPPCLNWLAEMNMTGKNFLDLTGDSDVACTPKAKKRNRKKKKKVQAPDSSLPSPATETVLPADLPALASNTSMPVIGVQTPATKVNYDVASGDSSCKGADVTTSFVKSLETLEEGEFAGSEISNDVCLQTSDNLVNTSLERGNVMALLPSSSGLSKTELVKADVSIVCDKANFRAVNSLVQSEEVAVSGTGLMGNDGLQSLHGMALSLEKNAAVISLSSPLPVSAGANKRKRKRKKKKGTDHSLGLSSTTVDTHEKHATQNSDQGLPADTGLRQSEDQASVSAIKMKDNVDLQLLQRVTVSPEKSGAPKFLQSPVEDCAEVPKVKRKNVFERLSGFPSSGATQSNRGPRDSDRPNYCADISLNSEKGKTKSEEINAVSRNGISNDDLRSIHGNGEIEVHPNSVVASPDTSKVKKKIKTVKKIKKIKTVKKIKKKLTLLDSVSLPRSSVKCGVHDELVNATTCNDCITAASISDKGQKKSDTETLDDVSSHSLHERPLSTENSLEERSPINMVSVRHGINVYDDRITAQPNNSSSFLEASTFPDGHPASAQSNIISSSLVEDSTILNVYSSVENSLQIVMPSDVIESESGGREGAVHVDTAGKTRVLGRDIVKDIAMPSVGQEKLNNLCGQLQDPVFNEKSQSEAMEEELDALPVRAESSSLYTYVSPREEASGTSITNSNEEGVDSIAERPGSLDGQHLQILDSRRSQCRLSSRPLSDSERNVKSNQTTEAEYVTPKKTLALPSSLNQQSTYTLRPKVGTMIGKKTYQVPSVSKVLPARASLPSGYIKKTDSSTHSVGPRTWRRTADPLPQKVSCGTADHLQRPSVKKAQSTSYIRKGNSLVRKFAPVATTPQVSAGLSTSNSLLSNTSRGELRSTVSENKEVNCSGLKKFPTSGFERSKTPLLPHNIKLPIGSTKSSLATTSSPVPPLVLEGASEPTPGPAYRKADNNIGASNQNGLNKETGNRGVLDDGKSLPSNMKEITYVKRKSNQLVASCSTSHNVSSSSAENTQPLCLTTPSDQYYKKNKNQLIRTAPSSKGDLRQAAIPDDGSNSESQKASKVPSLRSNRSINKRKLDKGFLKTRKPSKFSLVWTLHDTQTQKEDTSPLQRLKVYPYLFPWKRTTQWRNCKFNLISSKGSFSRISKKLLLSRKRDAVYTRSTGGFSLRKSKVLSIGGSNLKWSKSIENRSKKANEEATLAVAAVERKKREQKGADCTIPAGKRKNQSSRERIFRIGSVRYKMDASKCTLQRIPDEESAGAVDHQSGNGTRKSFIPKRLLIDNDEYIRIGNGNKLVRDPKKLVRILASEKVRWSLHTARLRLAKKQQYCQFFTRFGKCNKGDGKCPYIHDPAKIAVCTKFLKGLCSNTSCKLTHKVIPERMEDCSYFLQGLCTNGSCPYRHVNVNPNASVCEGFLRGYCANGNECRKKHSYVCPIFKSTGICPQGSICKLHHPKSRSKTKKQRSKASKSTQGRYFGSKLNDTGGRGTVSADMHTEKNDDGIFTGHSDYISLDFGDEEGQDTDGAIGKYTMFYDSDSSDLQSDELDELIKPVRLMNK